MSAPRDPELVLDRVTRRFEDVVALDRLDLTIGRGEVVGLLGHNGAGKTTTVRLLAGLLSPDEGTVRVGGLDPAVDGPRVRRRLGVLPADPVVDRRMTARQNLYFAADVFGIDTDGLDARVDAMLARFGLGGRGGDKVADFSTGMRQRLSLARVLLPDPEVLLLDEPTAALDPVAARQVRRELAALAAEAGRTVVVATHDLAEAELLCDRVVVLEEGRTVVDGSPAELAAAHGTGGLLLEVAPDQVEVVRARLSRLAAVRDVEVVADGRVRARGVPRDEVPGLVWALSSAELAVYEVRRLDPTLEEVYLALHEGDDVPAPRRPPASDRAGASDDAGEVAW